MKGIIRNDVDGVIITLMKPIGTIAHAACAM